MAMDINQLQQMQQEQQQQQQPTDIPNIPQEMQQQQPEAPNLPSVKESVFLILALLDHVVQKQDLNLQVQVQAIQGLTQSVKTLSDVLDAPSQSERLMGIATKIKPEMLPLLQQNMMTSSAGVNNGLGM